MVCEAESTPRPRPCEDPPPYGSGRLYGVPPGTCFCLHWQTGPHLCGRPTICIPSPALVCGTASISDALPTPAPALGGVSAEWAQTGAPTCGSALSAPPTRPSPESYFKNWGGRRGMNGTDEARGFSCAVLPWLGRGWWGAAEAGVEASGASGASGAAGAQNWWLRRRTRARGPVCGVWRRVCVCHVDTGVCLCV